MLRAPTFSGSRRPFDAHRSFLRPPSLRPHTCVASSSEPAVGVQATPAAHTDLIAAVEKLISLKESSASKEDLEQQIDHVTHLSVDAGTDKIILELNNGNFQGYTLTGQTAQRFSTVINLGTMSFNKYKPTSMKVMMSKSQESGGVYKGPQGPSEQAYVVTATFDFVEQPAEDQEAKPTGLKGRHLAIAEYKSVPDNPQRLIIQFKRIQLEPGSNSPEHLQRWLDTLLPHNPEMDPKTGVLNVAMPEHPPEAWLDHVLMIPEYQLLQGNFGSVTLLKRVE